MKVLLLHPEQFGFFSDTAAYVEILRQSGVDMAYGGFASRPADLQALPYTHHMHAPYTTGRFLDYCANLVDTLRPDLVHVFHFRGAGLLPWRVSSNPVWVVDVRTVHVMTRHNRPSKFGYLRDRLTWIETLQYDHVLALNETLRRRLSPARSPVEVIPLGVDAAKFKVEDRCQIRKETRRALGIADDAVIVVYAGALASVRRLDHVMAAFAQAAQAHPALHFLIVGGDSRVSTEEDVNIQALRSQAASLAVTERVHFTGRVPTHEIPGYYAASDIGVTYLPPDSPFRRQAPTKLIEYMVAGLVSVTNVTPAAEEIYQDARAAVVTGNTVADIADGLLRAAALSLPQNQAQRQALLKTAACRGHEYDLHHLLQKRLIPLYAQWSRV